MKRSIRWAWLVCLAGVIATGLPPAWSATLAAPAAAVKTVGVGYLENVVFERFPGKERVTLAVSKQSGVTVEKQPGNAVLVRLKNLFVPEELRRPLDDPAMANILRVTPAPKAAEDLSWVVAIELKQMVPYSVRQEGMNVLIDFNVASVAGAGIPVLPPRGKPLTVEPLPATRAASPGRTPQPAETTATPASRISLDVQDADIRAVFRLLSELSKASIVSGDDVKGTLSLHIKDVPWDQALDTILGIKGLSKIQKDGIIMVMTQENYQKLKKAEEESLKKAEAERLREEKKRLDAEPLITRIVPIKYRILKLAVATVDKQGQKIEEKPVTFKKDILLSSIKGEAASDPDNAKGSREKEGSTAAKGLTSEKGSAAAEGSTVEEKKIEDVTFFIQFLHNFLSRDAYGNRKGWIAADAETNSIIITAIKRDVDVIVDMIQKTDVPTDQIMIKANIVETTKETSRNLGIQWGGAYGRYVGNQSLYITPGGTGGSTVPPGSALSGGYDPGVYGTGTTGISGTGYGVNFPASAINAINPASLGLLFGTIGGNILDVQLSALQNDGKLNILSSPSLVTLDNQTASTENGEDVPFTTPATANSPATVTWKKAVLRLEITPHVIDGKTIKMTIIVKKDEPDYTKEVQGNPPIIVKETKTELVVADGETIVISGFTKQTKDNTTYGVPWFKEIPLLGWLFKKEAKNESMEEVLIFITPNIVKPQIVSGIQEGI